MLFRAKEMKYMKHLPAAFLLASLVIGPASLACADVVLEPFSYTENFESRTLGAWASYPPWQDTAYDPNFRVNEIVPGDPNLSIEQRVTPYTNVDNYAGAQKLLDMYLVPGATVSLRYYLKSHLPAEFFKVRFAAGEFGKIDVTIPDPALNRWEWVTLSFVDFVKENPRIAGMEKVKVNALAVLTKFPDADPDMPVYLGLDDITFKGARAMAFKFAEPAVCKLPEFKPYIPKSHYCRGDTFKLSGDWNLGADKVALRIVSFTDTAKVAYSATLAGKGNLWSLKPLKLSFPEGLYLGKLTATKGGEYLSDTEFTIHIAPRNIGGQHPRLLFDSEKKAWMDERFKEDRFRDVYENIVKNAASQRERIPVESLVYDLDQFPDEKWLATWSAWGSHIYNTDSALRWNSLAWVFHGDREAGIYAKDVLVRLAGWPDWTHPWQTKRGRFSEHRTGGWAHRVAFAYDCTYDLMSENERLEVRRAIMKNIVGGAFKTYVYNDNITGKTSNWLAMICGGALTNMAAMFGDGPDVENMEPYFTGTMIKFYAFIERVTDSVDGAWGEGLGYNNYSFTNMSYSAPSLLNVFNIDVTGPLVGTYREYIWAGLVKDRRYFYFGDSGGNLNPIENWAFLLDRSKDPLLGWYYNYLRFGKVESNTKDSVRNDSVEYRRSMTFQDVLYDTENVPQDDPFDENPVRMFREVGTTVFKSGWEADDFVFVMRTGAFYNHQHLDQGSFWLADRGAVFMEERHNSTYYDDPLYQSWYTQPVGHSTILIDRNHQSQRVGDHLRFAGGFHDHAFIHHFLDGRDAAFSSGDIGRLYWGKVKCLRRNVLYLKPRTLVMLDTAVPGERDVDVTMLYQTAHLEDIAPGEDTSTVTKEGATLHIMHLAPGHVEVEAVETPHYLYTLQREKPLRKEGMLTVTARTAGNPLVVANLLTTTPEGGTPPVSTEEGPGFVTGTADGARFAFSTRPGRRYVVGDLETDAAAISWSADRAFAALCTVLKKDGRLLVSSEKPMTFEVGEDVSYCLAEPSEVMISAPPQPSVVTVNGEKVTDVRFDNERKAVVLTLPAGWGTVSFKWPEQRTKTGGR